jgi:hypothetical protein
MTKALIVIIATASLLALLARHDGFLPYPAAPISVSTEQVSTTMGKGDYPGPAGAPPPSYQSDSETLSGFDAANTSSSGCYEDSVTPSSDGENTRVLKCAATQTDVPFFGPGAPSNTDAIWLLYWLVPVDRAKPYGYSRPLAHSACASYGACWLAQKHLDAHDQATFSENTEMALRAHTAPPVNNPTPNYCKSLKNTPQRSP